MWNAIFSSDVSVLEKLLRTILVYALIVVLFRMIGKRAIASLNTLDFVVMFLLSNVVQNAIIGNDTSVTGGAIGAVTLVLINALCDRLAYSSSVLRWLLEGTPTQIVEHGRVDAAALKKLGIRSAELDHAVRLQNGDDISEVWSGTLEPSGQLVLTLREDQQGADQADVAALTAQLNRIEKLLLAGPLAAGRSGSGPGVGVA